MSTKLLALLLPATLLAGCNEYRGLETRHQPVVSRTDYAFDLTSSGYGLGAGEGARLAGWLASLRVGYGDTIALDDPSAAPGARAEIASQAASRGLLLAETAPITAAPIAPGTVRVVVSRATASVPTCPDYRAEDGVTPNFSGRTSSNYGCGTSSTLAAMVANPIDLVRGTPGALAVDPAVSTKAIEAYRKAPLSGGGGQNLKAEATGGGR